MNVDPEIVTLTLIIGAVVMSGGLFGVTRGYLGQVRGVSRWAAATLMQALGWTLIGPLRGLVPDLISIVLGYGLLTLSQAVYLIVVAEFTDARIRPPWVYGTVVVQSIALAYFTVARPTAIGRMTAVTTCTAILMLKSSQVLLASAEHRRPGHRFTALLFAACGAVMLASDLCLLDWGPDLNRASMPLLAFMNDVSYAVFFATTTLLSFGFVLMVSVRYIVLQEQARAALSKSEARFKTMFVQAPLGSAMIDSLTGRILEVNPRFAEITGRTLDKVRNIDWMGITHPDDVQTQLDQMALMRAGETSGFRMDKRYLRPDGAEVWVDLTITRLDVEDPAHPCHLGMVQDITDRKRAEETLRESVREKEALLKETHHRVKNNLALIASLMRLESGRSREPETKATLNEMQTRIRSVVLLNETLYRTGSYATVQLAGYLKQIATHVFQAQNADADAVRLVLDLEPVEVETAQAIPCGLIVNELITNSLKHAFNPGGPGEVRVLLRPESGGQVRLSVSDTGSGLPADFSSKNLRSLGLQLVSDLARQLAGHLDIGPQASFTLTFASRRRAETIEIPPPTAPPRGQASR